MGVFRSQHVDGESARCGVGGPLDVESTRMPLQYCREGQCGSVGDGEGGGEGGRDEPLSK
jgi:hypothetical protein